MLIDLLTLDSWKKYSSPSKTIALENQKKQINSNAMTDRFLKPHLSPINLKKNRGGEWGEEQG